MLHRLVEVFSFGGRFEEPSGGPCQLVAVTGALVVLLAAGYRQVIEAVMGIGEFVQLPRMLQTLDAVLGIDVAEDDAGGGEGGRRFASEIGTCGKM